MSKMQPLKQQKCCPNCGDFIVWGTCQSCGLTTRPDTSQYLELKCKSAALTTLSCISPLIIAVFFGMGGLGIIGVLIMGGKNIPLTMGLIPVGFVSSYLFFLFGRTVWRYTTVKKKGTHIQGVILSYENNESRISNEYTKVAKILLDTPLGPGIISYETFKKDCEYSLNTPIDLMVYKDYYLML